MNESDCVGKLLGALEKAMPGGVGFKHHDTVTSGIPDVSWTWGRRTMWIECKYGRGAEIRPGQDVTMRRLARTGLAVYVHFDGDGTAQVIPPLSKLDLRINRTIAEVASYCRGIMEAR